MKEETGGGTATCIAPPTIPKLIVYDQHGFCEVLLDAPVMRIGRGGDAEIQLAGFEVSRRHALLVRDGAHTVLHDLGGRNGIRINGEHLRQGAQRRLRDGDQIGLGNRTMLYQVPVLPAEPAPDEVLEVIAPEEVDPAAPPAPPGRSRVYGPSSQLFLARLERERAIKERRVAITLCAFLVLTVSAFFVWMVLN